MTNNLTPKKEVIKAKRLYGFDIETYGDNNEFIMGSIVNETEKYVFWDKKRLQDFILKNKNIRSSYLFATSLGFDFLGTMGNDFKLLAKFSYICRGSDFIYIGHSNKKTGHKVNFLDTMNFYKKSVAQLGKDLGIPKLKKPSFLGKYPKNQEQRRYLEKYNIRDSYISFKFAEFLQNNFNDIGTNLKYTIAATGMNLFRSKYLKLWIRQPERKVLQDMFLGYYGGRAETIYRGRVKNAFYYDVNSLYPFSMANKKYPYPNSLQIAEKPTIDLIHKYEGLSLCDIETTKDLMYPLLPLKTENEKGEKKLIFPLGKFYGWHTHVELRKALKLGYIIKPVKTYYYTKTFNPFKDFVTDMFNKRMEFKRNGDNRQLIFKILMNSLYGKFAQKLNQSELMFITSQEEKNKILSMLDFNLTNDRIRYKIDSPDYDNCYYDKYENLITNPRLFYVTDLENTIYPKFINPILSIYTTSYSRLELYELIEEVLNNNKRVFYYDTDSIITDYSGFKTSDKLGDLKLEHEIKEAILVKPKFYFIKNKYNTEMFKCKGVRFKNHKDFLNALKFQTNKNIRFSKFRESIRRGFNFNQKYDMIKLLQLEDNKRLWSSRFNRNEFQVSTPITVKLTRT